MMNFYKKKKALNVKFNVFHIAFILFLLVLVDQPSLTLAEGVEQYKPDTTKSTALMILNTQVTYGTFASFSAADTNRLFIHINNPATEKIYFGIGGRSTNNDWYFRIKNPNGVVIYGPTLLPTAAGQQGFIQYYKQAIIGPNVLSAQGYNGFAINPTAGLSGNYYIEFNQGSGTVEAFNTEIDFEIFDVAVINTSSNTETQGRLFSYNWSFNTSSFANPFYGSFYIYGADSSVTKVDMNGIKPYKFRVSCNSFGTSKTGSKAFDRRSKVGFAVLPELRVFLRDPDLTAYPSGLMIFMNGAVTLSRCVKDSICINVNLTKAADVTIFIDRNGNGVYNPGTTDIKLFFPATPAGPNCLFWNAKDGLGNYVAPGSSIAATINISVGEVDLPMFDVENHETGYSLNVLRPGAGIFVDSLFYDDQLVGGSTNLIGCPFPCHTWASNPANTETNSIGNNNTMNTYWFAHTSSTLMNLTMPDYLVTSAGANQIKCVKGSNQDTIQLAGSIAFSVSAYNGSKMWTTTGTGIFSPNDSLYNSKYIPSAADIAAGSVTFYLAPRYNCWTPVDTVTITLRKVPQVSSSITNVECFSQATGDITLSVTNSTSPYTFSWNNGVTTQNLSNVVSGNYTVTVTSANGCTTTSTATITQPASAISAVLTSSGNVSCYGGSNGAINATVSGGTTPYNYNWNNGATTQDLASVAAGTYTLTATDANGCSSTLASVSITQPAASLSSSTVSTTNVSCTGGGNGAININVTGGTSPYTYNWSNGATVQDLTNITSGIYSVTVTDAKGCTDVTSGISITQPASALSASTSSTNNVSCFGGSNGSINLTVSGGTTPYTYNWSNGAVTQNLSNIAAGTYSVTITDAHGCTKAVSAISITQPAGSLSSSVNSSSNVSCFGGTNGNITLNITGGTTPYTYAWSNGATTQNITNVVAGTYGVTITDNHGCTTSTSGVSITQPGAALSSNASSTINVSCFGGNNGSVNLNVTGGTSPYSYNWSNGSVSQDLSNVPAGNYSVIITDAHGCTTSTSGLTITQPAAALSSTNSHVNVLCRSNTTGSINITVTGGTTPYTFNWSNGANTEDLTNISAGTYTVTITDDNGCTSSSAAITVTQPAAVLAGTATTTGNVACNSGANGTVNLTVTGGTSPYTYSWSNGATTQDIGGLFAGNYVVTITDANGCSATSASTVSQPAGALSSSISTSQNVSCYGGANGSINLTVSGGTTPYTYNWSNGSTIQDISGLSSGSYTVTVYDGNGCINISTAVVTQPTGSLSSNASSTNAVSCFGGSDGTINLSVTGGTTPYSFTWSNGSHNQNLTGLAAGNYSVTVTDANGCATQTSAITISQPAAALNSSTSSTNNVSCFGGNNGAINLTVTGGTLPYSYNWSTGDNTQNLSNLSAGNYSVTVTDANGCTTQKSAITISQPPAALNSGTSASNNVSCFGGTNGSITLSVNGGTTPYSYNWSNGANSQNLNNIPAGTYSVVVTDSHGCTTATAGISISQPGASLSSNVSSSNNVYCFGGANGAINLNVNGGTTPYSFSWSNGRTTQNLSSAPVGTYTVSITDAHGCTTSNSGLSITQPGASLSSNAGSTSNVSCNGGNNGGINLIVSGGTTPYSYQWNNGTTTQNLSNISAGNYIVTVSDINGCTTSVSAISVTEPPAALNSLVSASGDVSCFGGSNGTVTLSVTGGTTPYTFNWSNGTHSQTLSNVNAGTYSVTVIDANGCTTANSGIVITQPAGALSASVSASQNVSCYAGANGSINLSVNGGTSPYSYSWSTGAVTQDISGLSSGNYTVTIIDANGCTFNQFASITQPSASLSASASVTQNVSCFAGSNASINLSTNGGTTPYSYLWSNGSSTQNVSNISSGTYTVTVTDANGCIANQTKTVTQPANALSASSTVSQNVSCFFGSNGAVNVSTSGGTIPYSYLWNNGATSQNINSLTAGAFTVVITDANGCTTSQSQVVTQPTSGLSASATVSQQVSCYAGANGTVSLSVSGGTTPYSYNWSNSTTNQNLSNLSAGSYNVTITDANGCTFNSNAIITQPAAGISATASVTQNVSCNAGTNGSIDLTVNGGTAPYTYDWTNGSTTQDISNLSAGAYTVAITDANGCAFSKSATITQPSSALSASSTVTGNISCFSGNNGSIDLSVNGGTSPYSYSWNTGAASQDLSGLSAGSYSVTVTDANGCTANNTAVISQPAGALSSSITVSSNVLCHGGNAGTIDLSVSGGTAPYTYNWSNGNTTQDLSGLSAGVYTATITDANGCNSSVTGTITQPSSALGANAFVSQNVSCFAGANGSVTLTVSGGTTPYSYSWSNGLTTQNINNLSSGTYTVNITDANGCTQTANGTVTQPTGSLSASASTTQNVLCYAGANGSIDLTVIGGTSPYTYSWSNGANTEDIAGLISGTYIVNITDGNGCTSSQSGTVTQPSGSLSATASTTQNVSCFSGTNGTINLAVNGGTFPYTFNWSNGASTQNISNLSAGAYTVSITDANGCTYSQTGSVSQPAGSLTANASVTQNVSCNSGANGAISLSVNGGTMPYSYNWSNSASTQNITNLTSGTYTVTITDANGCTSIQSKTVIQPSGALSATAAASQNVSCFSGANGSITLTVTGGTVPYSYNWSNGLTTQNLANLSSGNYSVTITDVNGCTANQAQTITQPSAALSATSSANQNVSCFGGTNGSVTLNVNGGTTPYSYNWSNGASTQNLNSLSSGTYIVTVTDVNGCTANQTQNITQPSASLSAATSANQNVSCFGGVNGSVTLTIAGGTSPYTFNWSNGVTAQNISNLTSGTYTVTVTDANGCTANQAQTITQPSASLSASNVVNSQVSCFGGANGSINLTVSGGTGPYSYNWSNGANTQDINGLSSGNYTVTITDANGCSTLNTASVTQPTGALSATASTSQNVSCNSGSNGSMTVSTSGGTTPYTYNWSNGASTQNISNLTSGTYTVTITDANGCITTQNGAVSQPSASLSATSSANQNVSCYSGANGAITLNVSGGTTPYSYNWSNGATTQNITSLAAGSYTVSITDINGCTANQTQAITQPSAGLAATASASQNVSCFAGNNAAINVTVNGGTTPYIYDWSNGSNTQNLSNLTSGIYTVTVTDANACTEVQSVTITQPSSGLSANSTVTGNISCFSGNNGSIDLTAIGGTSPYSYNWNTGATTQDLSGLAAGSYSVTVTDANGCTAANNAAITQPAGSLSASISLSQGVLCNGGNNGSINLTVGGGTNPYTYNWSNGATSQDISNLSAGTYTATITDANGCNASVTGIISQPSASLSASASVTQNVSCYSGSNGTISLTVNGGTAPYNFNWSNGATTEDISNLSVGTYIVSITDANGCTSSQNGTVTQPTGALSATASTTQNVSCYSGANGSIDLTVIGGTSPYNFTWSNGSTTEDINNLSAGTYIVSITDANGCTSAQSGNITQPTGALSASTSTTQNVSCYSGANGSIDLTVIGGTSPYTFNWSNSATTEDINNLSVGIYTVSITDANGCSFSETGSISQPVGALSSSTTVTGNISCFSGNNGSIDLTVSGGTLPYTYMWNTGTTTEDIINLSAGNYTVSITDANGCTSNSTASITQPSGSLATNVVINQQVSCFAGANGSINLTVNGGTLPYTYNWSNGATTQSISNLSAGAYTATINDANGCNTSATGIITQPAGALNAAANVSQNVSCYSGSNGTIDLTATNGTGPYTFNWSNGATTEDISSLNAGNYTVTVTDANGCSTTTNATVTQPTGTLSATLNSAQPVSCFAGNNGSIDLTTANGTSPYSYSWSNGATTEDISNLSSGIYTVTVTDANGCTANQTQTITQPSASLSASSAVNNQVSCFGGSNGSVNLNVSGGTAPYSYNWSNGSSSQDINGLSSGSYTVTITDANGCTAINSATITQPSGALSASASTSQNVSCNSGSNGAMTISVLGGTAPYTYNWSIGASTQNIINLSSGIYTVTITDANGCTATQNGIVSQPSASLSATSSANQNVSCYGGVNGAITLNVSGGTAPYSYNWSNGATTQNISSLSAGTYTVSITDANGCTASQSQAVTQPSGGLSATANASQNVSCYGGSNAAINVTVNGGTAPYAFVWSNGANTQNLSNLTSGTYTVTITDANACTEVQTLTITQPSAGLSASSTVTGNISCFSGNNGSIDLTAIGGTSPYSFTWNTGATTEDLSGLAAGNYSVTVTDANGCTALNNVTITQPAGSLSATVSLSQGVLCNGGNNGSINLTVGGGTNPYNYSWSNGATTQNISNLSAGTYTATITDANGCNASVTGIISQPSASLSATASVTQNVSCFSGANGTINLTVNGGTAPYTFLWDNAATTEDISNLSSGTYTVSITDANGCTSTQNATVTQPTGALSATASTTQNVSCYSGANGSIDLTVNGGTAPYTYNWSNGSTTEDISNLAAGTYAVSITDANGCTSTQNGTVTQPTGGLSATASTTQNVSCFAGSNGTIDLTVNGGTSPYTFNWSNGASSEDISNLSSGTYTVSITDANGCSFTQNGTISQPSGALSASTAVTGNISCFSGNNGSIDLTVSGGTVPYTYTWNTGATTEDIINLSAGTYSVSITDANGCTSNSTATIIQPAGALSTNVAINQQVSCFAGSNGSINLTVNGGTLPYTYNWSNGATTEDVSNLPAGTYVVTILDSNGCNASATAAIIQPSAGLNASANVSQNVSCYGGGNGTIDLTATNGTAPYTFNWSNGATTEDISNLTSGTYTATVTDANGCTTITTASITQPSGALNATINGIQPVSCFAGNNGSLDVTALNGTAPYSYNWSTGATTQNIGSLPSGIYTVTITDANGCTTNATAAITQPTAALNANINVTQNVNCFAGTNGAINLTATNGTAPYIFNWSNGATTEDISNISAGTYTVTVTDANGCTQMASGTITQPSASLNASATVSQNVSCYSGTNGAINITLSGGTSPFTFTWSNGATTQNLTGLSSGNYSVTITDANGCSTAAFVSVTQPSASINANANVTQNVNCNSGTNGVINLTVTGGTFPYTFNWSNSATTEDLNNLSAGTYTVTVTDANGCTQMTSATVTQPANSLNANATVSQNVSCFGANTGSINSTATGGTAPYSYNWSTGSSSQNLTNLSQGTYTVTITDANGCTQIASGTITQPSASLSASATVSQNVLCHSGTNGAINITVSGGTSPFTFTWSNGATTQNLSGLSSGNYSVTITDANGCSTTAFASVTQPSASITANANVTQNVNCSSGTNGVINLTVTGGTSPYTFNWSNSATTEDLNSLSAGTYTVTVTDANGCTQTASATVTQPANSLNANANVSQNVSCFGANNGSVNSTATGGTAPYSYNWSTGSSSQNLTNLSQGTYTVTVTDAHGCTQTASATITQPSSTMSVTGSGGTANCLGGITSNVSINVNGGTSPFTYLWNNGNTTQNLSNQLAGTYSVTVTDANGCTTNGSYIITDQSAFNANASGPDICIGELAMLIADSVPGATYQWYVNGQILTGSNTNVYLTPTSGSYTVTVSNSCGTFTSDSIRIKVHTVDNISTSPNVIICPGESTQLNATGGVSYEWTPTIGLNYSNIPNPIASPNVTTQYTVTITDDFGCKATGDVQVGVVCDSLVIPSGFSPNGDVVNDAFVIKGLENYPDNKIWIYNRWGNLVYKTTNYANTWDGVCNVSGIYIGKKVPPGTYFYVLDLNNSTKPIQGYVVLKY